MVQVEIDDGIVLAADRDDSLRWQLVVENPRWVPALAVDPWCHPEEVVVGLDVWEPVWNRNDYEGPFEDRMRF